MAYHDFMNKSTIQQRGWIRRLRFEIMSWEPRFRHPELSDADIVEGWMDICDEVPKTLVSISLDIGFSCRLDLPGFHLGSWSFCQRGLRSDPANKC